MMAETFDEWLESIIQQGAGYIANLIRVYEDAITITQELETEVTTWEKERNKWVVVLVQMKDVQKYGVMKFLTEKAVKDLDDKILYVAKENIEWRNSITKKGHEESIKLLKQLKELIIEMQKDLKCIDVQLLKEDGQTIEQTVDMVENFKGKMNLVKESKSLTKDEFFRVAIIESMLVVYFDHLETRKTKVMQVSMDKEVWKQCILHIGLPHYQVVHNFLVAHMEW